MARLATAALLLALVLPASARAAEPPYSNADYWAFADRIMRQLDSWWDPTRDAYILRGALSVRVNSAMLLTHAIAARTGHDGPTRRDARARTLVDQLTTTPAWLGATGRGPLTTCWSRDLDRVSDSTHRSSPRSPRRSRGPDGRARSWVSQPPPSGGSSTR